MCELTVELYEYEKELERRNNMKKEAPNCYDCIHRRTIPGDAHTRCNNFQAKVRGNPTGIRGGWFMWPLNFDPTWLVACDGFSNDKKDNKPEQRLNPLVELFSMLR